MSSPAYRTSARLPDEPLGWPSAPVRRTIKVWAGVRPVALFILPWGYTVRPPSSPAPRVLAVLFKLTGALALGLVLGWCAS